jgi:predicted CopG family antitoxin
MKFQQVHLRVNDDIYNKVKNIAYKKGESISEVMRKLIEDGLTLEVGNENKDIISSIVREELKAVLKPNIERLAKISSKSGHMSATAAFLNVQTLMDLVPKENRREVRTMYEKARKMAIDYMKTKTDDWDIKVVDKIDE